MVVPSLAAEAASVRAFSFTGALYVSAIALVAPLLVSLAPKLRMPAVVLEIAFGILVGPAVLDWVHVDVPLAVLALIGLAFLLFLAGLEIDPSALRGRIGRLSVAFAVSLALAGGLAYVFDAIEPIRDPLFVAIVFASTSLGLVVPVLSDAGESTTGFGQVVLAASSLAEFGTILLISLFFSQSSSTTGSQIVLLVGFVVLVIVVGVGMTRADRSPRLANTLLKLENTSAQLGVRIAIALLLLFTAMATELGFEAILGAFVAGAILRVADQREYLIHPEFRRKIEAIGYGFLIPVFFVTSGMGVDMKSLFRRPEHLILVPLFLLALLVARGMPALLYSPFFDRRHQVAAGLLQATSLTFVVIAERLGVELSVFDAATGAALVSAGLLSVVLFPALALRLLGDSQTVPGADDVEPAPPLVLPPEVGPEPDAIA
ncbi:MAG: Na+/H+ antiporter-like protein [Actinomycetia bacterium]|nr:Na+/H+ antiporter-like protein [Actinomycetes bacterium]